MIRDDNEHDAEKLDELQKVYQFIELNKDFVLEHFTAYREKVKVIDILHLKLLNRQSGFKHELNLSILSLNQYQKKIGILDEKLRELELKKEGIQNQFGINVFGGASTITLPSESIVLYLQKLFL